MKINYSTNTLKQILDIINPTFGAVREEGFDFRKIMPKAYSESSSLIKYHYVLEDEGKGVAAAGNIPYTITTSGASYTYSFLGSVATLPQYEGRGYMRALMDRIYADDLASGKVFSLLTGARGRYSRYGYTKLFSSRFYTFDEYFYKHAHTSGIKIEELSDVDGAYELYLKTQPLILRDKETFLPSLQMSSSRVRQIMLEGRLVGYYCFCTRKRTYLPELVIFDLSLLEGAIKAILDFESVKAFSIYASPLSKAYCAALDKLCEEASLSDDIHIRVYDMQAFIKLLVELNVANGFVSGDISESVCIDNKCYSISIEGGIVDVQAVDSDIEGISQGEFLRCCINGATPIERTSIFPLVFGVSLPDCF